MRINYTYVLFLITCTASLSYSAQMSPGPLDSAIFDYYTSNKTNSYFLPDGRWPLMCFYYDIFTKNDSTTLCFDIPFVPFTAELVSAEEDYFKQLQSILQEKTSTDTAHYKAQVLTLQAALSSILDEDEKNIHKNESVIQIGRRQLFEDWFKKISSLELYSDEEFFYDSLHKLSWIVLTISPCCGPVSFNDVSFIDSYWPTLKNSCKTWLTKGPHIPIKDFIEKYIILKQSFEPGQKTQQYLEQRHGIQIAQAAQDIFLIITQKFLSYYFTQAFGNSYEEYVLRRKQQPDYLIMDALKTLNITPEHAVTNLALDAYTTVSTEIIPDENGSHTVIHVTTILPKKLLQQNTDTKLVALL